MKAPRRRRVDPALAARWRRPVRVALVPDLDRHADGLRSPCSCRAAELGQCNEPAQGGIAHRAPAAWASGADRRVPRQGSAVGIPGYRGSSRWLPRGRGFGVEVTVDLVCILGGGKKRLAGCEHPTPGIEDGIGSVGVLDQRDDDRPLDADVIGLFLLVPLSARTEASASWPSTPSSDSARSWPAPAPASSTQATPPWPSSEPADSSRSPSASSPPVAGLMPPPLVTASASPLHRSPNLRATLCPASPQTPPRRGMSNVAPLTTVDGRPSARRRAGRVRIVVGRRRRF